MHYSGERRSLVFRSPRPLRYAKAFVFWVKTALQVVVGLIGKKEDKTGNRPFSAKSVTICDHFGEKR